ncbi:endothelin-converting enzyme homolog [Haliotis rubra]|uniref:endothelin-converting enzyme homolog n=1 Tax=Haliotis rubra TaxID=36100 RepID=UPI001EE568D5|nr:endothelin-converting enzyme homolog [Haliotis rubra]
MGYICEIGCRKWDNVCKSPECVQTAGSVLARMNLSAEPCQNFYSFACGGYISRTRLTWNKTRIREIPDELPHRYKSYLIDTLSSGQGESDSPALKSLRAVFKSCISRSARVDDVTRITMTEFFHNLGGLHLTNNTRDSSFDMTSLLANVTRLYGATPFFKVLVHGPSKISLINRYSDHMLHLLRGLNDDVGSFQFLRPSDFIPRYSQKSKLSAFKTLLWSVVSMLTGSRGDGAARVAVEEVFYFQLELHKVLYDDDIDWTEDDVRACWKGHKSPIHTLNTNFGGYQITWSDFLIRVLGGIDITSVTVCHIHLSAAVQELLANTPSYVLKRYILIHTLFNTKVFSLLPKSTSLRRQLRVFGRYGQEAGTVEEQCVHTITQLLPNSLLCETTPSRFSHAQYTMETVFFNLKRSLSETLSILFGITSDETYKIANETVSSVSREWLSVLPLRESDVRLDQYQHQSHQSYLSNFIGLIKLRTLRYMQGEAHRPYNPVIPSVLGVLAGCKEFGFPYGGVWFPSPNPSYIHYASLGTYLARDISDQLDIQVLLDHYADDILNDSAVLYLAIRLQCLVDLYNHFEILRQGNTVFKVRGAVAKNENWKDHLSLKVAYENWRYDKSSQTKEVIIPGLKYSEEQTFFILYAQTMCEKVSRRGLIEHYINDDSEVTPPGRFRVHGALMNFRPFAAAFKCRPDSPMNPSEKCQIF